MQENELGKHYKEILHKEVDKIPEQDMVFLVKLIHIIRIHVEKVG